MSSNVLPFIFARLTEDSQMHVETCGDWKIQNWVVMIAIIDFKIYNCKWMNDSFMGHYCLNPDVDITTEDHHVFSDFESARNFVKEWWKNN